MKNYPHILRAVFERPWAVLPSTLGVIVEVVQHRVSGGHWTDEEIQARIDARAGDRGPRNGPQRGTAVAVIPIYGLISQRQNLMSATSGGTSVEGLQGSFREAMADPSISAIVFDVDSPGGHIDGIPELAAEIRAARGQKPMITNANAMAASAALWIGTAADEFVVTPSGQVGSIGIVTGHVDDTAAREQAGVKRTLIAMPPEKVDGWGGDPLSEEGAAELKAQVDELYGMFVSDVAKQRKVGVDVVRKDYGGRMHTAKQALGIGLVDRIETLDESIRRAARLAALQPSGQVAATTSDNDEGSALAALPFAAHSERVLLDVTALASRAGEIRALREADGRDLSATHRETLAAVAEQLATAQGSIAEAIAPAAPVEEPPPAPAPRNVRAVLAMTEMELGLLGLRNPTPARS